MTEPRRLAGDPPPLPHEWIDPEMPDLAAHARGWRRAAIDPVFPGLTCASQATLTTGELPSRHGIIANGLFDRASRAPELWVFPDEALQAPRIWSAAAAAGSKTGVFFFLNIRETPADVAILPKPIHHPDGRMEMWCWHKPEGLYPKLVKDLGHFNLLKFWGPMAGIESSRWIAEAARRATLEHDLDAAFVYLPHTDYAAQKFGPESEANRKAHRELDGVLAGLIRGLGAGGREVRTVIISEYAITDVSRCVFPNRILRAAGLLSVRAEDGREICDYAASRAFAVADHQIAHVYCAPELKGEVRALFEGQPGVAEVAADLRPLGLDHPRSGELLLIAERDAWFAYPWWEDFARAPKWAATIDIHNKPGYDPLEMFWDAKINGTAQDSGLIKGSHGAPARDADQKASLLTDHPEMQSASSTLEAGRALRAALVGAAAAR